MELKTLIPIGSEIEVDKSKIEMDIPEVLLNKWPKKIKGTIIDYKMNDGMEIGYVLMTNSKSKIWIFSHELNQETKVKYQIKDTLLNKRSFSSHYTEEYDLSGNYQISYLLNPLNLVKWLVYTLKDNL